MYKCIVRLHWFIIKNMKKHFSWFIRSNSSGAGLHKVNFSPAYCLNLVQISAENSYSQTVYLPPNGHLLFGKNSRQRYHEVVTYFSSVLLQGNDPSSWIHDFKRIKIFDFRFKKSELQQAENGGTKNHWQKDNKDPGFGHRVFQRISSCERLHFRNLWRGAWGSLECEGGAEIRNAQLWLERRKLPSLSSAVSYQCLCWASALLGKVQKFLWGGGKKERKEKKSLFPPSKDADCSV